MKLYHCVLVSNKGYQLQNFFREGESENDVRESLELFEFPKGEWRIIEHSEDFAEE